MIEQIAHLGNLTTALRHCRRGKRQSCGYQSFLLQMPTNLMEIREHLLLNTYAWSPYRSFYVCDPKRRAILAAPFRDRIVHQAIHQVISPRIDAAIPLNSYACRVGMGNRAAAQRFWTILQELGAERYTVKLDVSQYFFSIDHGILLQMLEEVIPDPSVQPLLRSLLRSHEPFAAQGVGIPIGNVTSQSFASLYLTPIDRMAEAEPQERRVRTMHRQGARDSQLAKVQTSFAAWSRLC